MSHRVLNCDVAVIGGSLGGVAAALAAAEAGARVVLTEATDWIGGQITSQGVAALDEHPYIEQFGGTRSYYNMREAIRATYRDRYDAPATMPDGAPLNPGNGWVSRLCFEPQVGIQVLEAMLAPLVAAGRLSILREHVPVQATVEGDQIRSVTLASSTGDQTTIHARYFLDATDLGDLLPLTGTEYVAGAEAQTDTGEPHAGSDGPHSHEVQGFTFCFAVTYRSGEDHTIPQPDGYERFRDEQPYTFTLTGHDGEPRPFRMFAEGPTGLPSFWTYRRLRDGALLDPGGDTHDIALINWSGNDYHWADLIDVPAAQQARIIDEAKRLALGFLHWLQTEAPRDDGRGRGYPGLQLVPEVMGTADGLGKAPYIREGRRIVALKRIVEDHISAARRSGARAAAFDDAVGIGWYHIDIHDCVGRPVSMYAPTLPFQISLGALIPKRTTNLIAACKNIGTTHITNGAYRLHPVEWNIGEAAGALAAFCCALDVLPHAVHGDGGLLLRLQWQLLARGVPLAWTIDVPTTDKVFAPTQMLVLLGAMPLESTRAYTLALEPEHGVSYAELRALLEAIRRLTGTHVLLEYPDETASAMPRTVVEQALQVLGAPSVALSAQPTWREISAALAPLIERTINRTTRQTHPQPKEQA